MEDPSLLCLSSSSSFTSVTGKDSSQRDSNHPPKKQEPKPTVKPGLKDVCDHGEERLLSAEENVSLTNESLTATSADHEKVLLLNKNTELRRVNEELMKLNEEWDKVYCTATISLQHRVESLVQENAAIKLLNNRLLLKLEHKQSAQEYYEQALMQELKKNQNLQDYIRKLEGRMHQKHANMARTAHTQGLNDYIHIPEPCASSVAPATPIPASSYGSGLQPPGGISSSASLSPEARPQSRFLSSGGLDTDTDCQQGVQDLKEQLEALRCQTQIYEAEYQSEHKDHKHTQQDNRRLRRKKEEMRQQVALLQEQLKVYEDDFRKERSDKQVLQRLLLKKNSPPKDPVLVHRCNNEINPPDGDKRTRQWRESSYTCNTSNE